jgi:hypothetical protein
LVREEKIGLGGQNVKANEDSNRGRGVESKKWLHKAI